MRFKEYYLLERDSDLQRIEVIKRDASKVYKNLEERVKEFLEDFRIEDPRERFYKEETIKKNSLVPSREEIGDVKLVLRRNPTYTNDKGKEVRANMEGSYSTKTRTVTIYSNKIIDPLFKYQNLLKKYSRSTDLRERVEIIMTLRKIEPAILNTLPEIKSTIVHEMTHARDQKDYDEKMYVYAAKVDEKIRQLEDKGVISRTLKDKTQGVGYNLENIKDSNFKIPLGKTEINNYNIKNIKVLRKFLSDDAKEVVDQKLQELVSDGSLEIITDALGEVFAYKPLKSFSFEVFNYTIDKRNLQKADDLFYDPPHQKYYAENMEIQAFFFQSFYLFLEDIERGALFGDPSLTLEDIPQNVFVKMYIDKYLKNASEFWDMGTRKYFIKRIHSIYDSILQREDQLQAKQDALPKDSEATLRRADKSLVKTAQKVAKRREDRAERMAKGEKFPEKKVRWDAVKKRDASDEAKRKELLNTSKET